MAVAPKFQLVAGKNKRSAVVTLSKSNVLAAVNAPDGEICMWICECLGSG